MMRLLVPGLLDPWPDAALHEPLPAFPLLEKLLARAERRPAPADYPRTLFSLLNMPYQPRGSLPTAGLCWLADSGEPPSGYVLHADPVYLKPDISDVQLFRPQELQLEEAQIYAGVFNEFYQSEDYFLHTPTADRWYLSTPVPLQTPAEGVQQVAGRNLRPFLGAGQQAREWSSLFTEIQMLFHELQVNQERQAANKLPVSGLWLSGGGNLPAVGEHGFDTFQGQDPLLQGLAVHTGVAFEDRSSADAGNALVASTKCQEAWLAMDIEAWLAEVQEIEKLLAEWITDSNQVILYPCNGLAWHWHRNSRYRVWRKQRGLSYYAADR